ncbi:MAG TPA: D-TA family PLP-dependent enzyme [Flavobacteriaceae bacterium]
MNWYEIENIDKIESPSLVLYEDRLDHNIQKMLDMVHGNPTKLMPHVKTSKMPEVIKRMVTLGIKDFKASTIAEAEITAREGAENIVIAHQLVGPKINRFLSLIIRFPNTTFATILDNCNSAKQLNALANEKNLIIDFYIDINSGMDRSGIAIGPDLDEFIAGIPKYSSLCFKGLHVYDGHIRQPDFELRKDMVEAGLKDIQKLFSQLKSRNPHLKLICGGTPTFTAHLNEDDRICSPGTCVLWDWGYGKKLQEQEFQYAALLITRVISKPTEGIVTIDLGHKSVAAENPIHQRVKFLNLDHYELLSQSEEHGVLRVQNWNDLKVGDVFYGVPYHICPTINLHDEVSVIRNEKKVTTWEITARKRKIEI